MFGIGMPELILILAVALIVIGPKKLPDLAKSLGKAMGEFKKATNDIKDSMQLDSGIQEVKSSFEDLEKELKKPVQAVTDPTPGQEETAGADTAEALEDAATDTAPPPEIAEAGTAVPPDADLTAAELEEYSPAPAESESDAAAGADTPKAASEKTERTDSA